MGVEIIAEIGSNWNGSFDEGCDLIDAAKECGADTVKFQHYPDKRYGPYPMVPEALEDFQAYAVEGEIGFLCSVFDRATLDEYVEVCDPTHVKIASPELTDHDLLRACREHRLHVIASTGMSTDEQIEEAWRALSPNDVAGAVTFLHCVSSYPAPPSEMNMWAMTRLSGYGDYGLSDHTLNPSVAPVMAVAFGASVIEKHFTLNKKQDGPDHGYALDPDGFAEMVKAVRAAELMLGDGVKRVMPSEDPTARRTGEWRAA